jgi:large subunit ribosomal protein L21
MFAVIKTGGKQYKVAANDVLKIEKLDVEAGDVVTFDEVLMVGDGDAVTVGAPLVAGARVAGHLVETRKQDTVIIFKKRRRHNSRRRNGHRQLLSTVRISEILIGGAQVTTVPDEKIKAKYAALMAANAPAVSAAEADQQVKKPAKAPKAEAAPVEAKPAKASKPKPAKADGDFIDDIKLISGVGPALDKKLGGAGVTSLTQIAAWTSAEIEKIDAELGLNGRIVRDEWVEQARDLVAGKPPRAKADQELEASEKAEKAAKPAKKAAPKADKE